MTSPGPELMATSECGTRCRGRCTQGRALAVLGLRSFDRMTHRPGRAGWEDDRAARMAALPGGVLTAHSGGGVGGDLQADVGAATWGRVQAEPPADQGGPLAHAEQPEAALAA